MIRLAGAGLGGMLFDKDGTLLDFHRTWDRAVGETLRQLADDRAGLEGAASAVGYDLESGRVEVDSPIVAESNATIGALLEGWIDTRDFEAVLMANGAAGASPASGAEELLDRLADGHAALGVVTNDSEAVAREQLRHLGWDRYFSVVVGYDSGYGAKPDPGPVLAAVDALGLRPGSAALVGDSVHDVVAARDAGVLAIYVGHDAGVAEVADLTVGDLDELASRLG